MAYDPGQRPSFRAILRDLNGLITSGAGWWSVVGRRRVPGAGSGGEGGDGQVPGRGGKGSQGVEGPASSGKGPLQYTRKLLAPTVSAIKDSCSSKQAPWLKIRYAFVSQGSLSN